MFKKFIVLAVVAVIIVSCFWLFREQPDAYSGPVEKVTLGAEASLLPAAVWVAEDKGYFKEEGLDITIKKFDSGRLSFLAMLKG
jgi:ABC-type nitrate/sulfonate/bicarbonate transport system substrate-binding protein